MRSLAALAAIGTLATGILAASGADERQLTHAPNGHILTHAGVWSPDGQWIVYDVRPDAAGSVFTGDHIEAVNVNSGEVRGLYRSQHGADCGVASWSPVGRKIVFILGPENPTPDWQYSQSHRQGVILDLDAPGGVRNLDACDLSPLFTPGALRGGSHLHLWDAMGDWVSFTCHDALAETEIRDVGIAIPNHPVVVGHENPRNHDGGYFSLIVTRTTPHPRPGSDEIRRACEEAWVGTNGYVRPDGTRQKRALAFQGSVVTGGGQVVSEAFVVDLPDDPVGMSNGFVAEKTRSRPGPPREICQRRLTHTVSGKFPGLQGPRHWLCSSPDGSRIGFLMKDDQGVIQFWTISPNGGPVRLVTHNAADLASAFSWSPDGRQIAQVMDNCICVIEVASGRTTQLTPHCADVAAPRPEACVFSPDGRRIAYVRPVETKGARFNQIFVLTLTSNPASTP